MLHILIVEDDLALTQQLVRLVHDIKAKAWVASSLGVAHQLLETRQFDLIILDRGLPDGDGLSLLRTVASQYGLPVVILSAEQTVLERIKGLRAGAVEYIGKPFSREEFILRLRNVLRQAGKVAEYSLQLGELQFWPGTGRLLLRDQELQLSRRETQLFNTLAKHMGQTLTKTQLIQHIWQLQVDQPNDETIEVYIRRLRKRLPKQYQAMIQTVKGFGYRLVALE